MSMRAKFVAPGASIYYYIVEWDSAKLPWEDFRGKVLGPTDPADAPADSLRGAIYKDWKDLGLSAEPNTGDNGVHASASPFEGLSERMNWLGYRIERDNFGKLLLKAGVPVSTIKDWCKDPQVTFGPIPMTKSLFDTLEDTDSDWCAGLCQMIAGGKKTSKPDPQEAELNELKKQVESYEALAKAVATIQAHKPPAEPKKSKEEKAAPKAKAKAEGKAKAKAKGKAKAKAKAKAEEE